MPYPPGLEISNPPVLSRKADMGAKKVKGKKQGRDSFSSLKALKESLEEGRDFQIEAVDRESSVTVVAPHGGLIESGTSELARSLAGEKYNLFDFQALSQTGARKGHVTSTNFREPRLSKMLETSRICVSFHRMRDRHKTVYLGGNNSKLKALVASNLAKAGFLCDSDPPRLKGKSKRNFVNLAREAGLQIEIPGAFALELMPDLYRSKPGSRPLKYEPEKKRSERYREFVQVLDSAIAAYLAEQN